MSKDFSGQDLRGRSFKNQNLEGADFSNADIRGANFKGANLRGANFTGAKAGLRKHWALFLVLLCCLASGISSFFLLFDGLIILSLSVAVSGYKFLYEVVGYLVLFLTIPQYIIIIQQGITWRFVRLVVVGPFLVLFMSGAFAAALAFIFATALVLGGAFALTLAFAFAVAASTVGGAFFYYAYLGVATATEIEVMNLTGLVTLGTVITIAVAIIDIYIAWQAIKGNEEYVFIRNVAVGFAAIKGTSFRSADLTNANFSSAQLRNTDFRKANLTRTRFYETKKTDLAIFDNAVLAKRDILNLLVTGNGREKSYSGANLKGANLQYADLKGANLKDADITEATFERANLEGANLTLTQAIDTDFSNAYMTGACVEAWNIESTTNLDNVDCRFVYLLENPKPGTDDKERRPSSGEFGQGEFTKLFQEVLSTVDIIFRDGIDWKAFIQSFRQVQVENEGTELSVNSIENKGDGVFVIKVNTPPNADKEKIHSELVQCYEEQLKALESRYNLELQAKDRDIDKYRQRYTDIQEITKLLAEKQVPLNSQPIPEKVVLLKLDSIDETTDILVTAQIWVDNHFQPISFEGKLSPATPIIELYNCIHKLCNPEDNNNRAGFLKEQVTTFSEQEIKNLSNELEENINNWFNSPSFTNVANQLRSKLNPSDSIRFIIQTSDIKLKLLPLHLWEFFDDYRKAEIALSAPQSDRLSKSIPNRKKVRVLVILGNSENIELGIQADLEALNQLPLSEIKVLSQPNKQDLHEQLWHPLGWDILCFCGHSDSEDDGSTGIIEISPTEKLSLKYLKSALTNAIENGLQLAIFNSCKGLGIAQDLAELHIPQIIVMRQPVPDEVAQVFLKNFLQAFANGKSLYNSVREARQKLEGLEDRYPCASWLPVICQNPAEVPLKWLQFPGAGKPQIDNLLTQLHRLIEEDYTITPDAQTEALEQVKMIAEALQIQDELVDKRQVKTNITLLRGILAGTTCC